MERLTKRNEKGIAYLAIAETLPKEDQKIEGTKPTLESIYAVFQRLAAYEDSGLEPEELQEYLQRHDFKELHDHISELLVLEKQGRLIKLSCQEGDTIYVLEPNGTIRECKVYNITTNIYADTDKDDPYWKGFEIKDDLFGKTVFLTKQEAEQALKGAEK